MATKTQFIYGLVIFYTIVTLLVSSLGSMVLENKIDIRTPSPILEDPLGTTGDETEFATETNYCDTGFDENGITDWKKTLIPTFMRPLCVGQTTEKIGNDYVNGLLDESEYQGKESKFGFIPNMVVGFSVIPDWLNAIIFTPLVVSLLFVLVTTIGGIIFDGGS